MTLTDFVPYSQRAPDTTDLRELRQELARVREVHGRRSSEALEAYGRLHREACRQGQPLDGLRKHATNEVERFFAQTIPGPDGHVYWDGPKYGFRRNDGKERSPRRWWWAHRHARVLDPYNDVVAVCGDLACINPEHCQEGRHLRRRRFSDEQMLNAVKVVALRLGRAPSGHEWDRIGGRPALSMFKIRFGPWRNVIAKAGLVPHDGRRNRMDADKCLQALLYVYDTTGDWPVHDTFSSHAEALRARGLPTSPETIRRHLGIWPIALHKARKLRP